jgi:hypothetical protein
MKRLRLGAIIWNRLLGPGKMNKFTIFNKNKFDLEVQIEPTGESYFVSHGKALQIYFLVSPNSIDIIEEMEGFKQVFLNNGSIDDRATNICSFDEFMRLDDYSIKQ